MVEMRSFCRATVPATRVDVAFMVVMIGKRKLSSSTDDRPSEQMKKITISLVDLFARHPSGRLSIPPTTIVMSLQATSKL